MMRTSIINPLSKQHLIKEREEIRRVPRRHVTHTRMELLRNRPSRVYAIKFSFVFR